MQYLIWYAFLRLLASFTKMKRDIMFSFAYKKTNYLQKHKFFGFTLAEVLITLGIIGVVAMMVIPAILNYTFQLEAVSKVKKTYALLASAVEQWQTEGGCTGNSSLCSEYDASTNNNCLAVANGIAPYLKYQKAYFGPSDAVGKTIEWLPDTAYLISGTTISYANWLTLLPDRNQIQYGYGSYFLLQDGTTVILTGVHHLYYFIFDINGIKKPNRIGKDIFIASIWTPQHQTFSPYAENGYGSGNAYGVCGENATNLCNPDDGYSPTAYVLKHDKLPDFKKMGLPVLP